MPQRVSDGARRGIVLVVAALALIPFWIAVVHWGGDLEEYGVWIFLSLFVGLMLIAGGLPLIFRSQMQGTEVTPFTDAPLGHEELAFVYDRSDTVLSWRRRTRRMRFRTLPSISFLVVLLLWIIGVPVSAIDPFRWAPKGIELAPLQKPNCLKDPKLAGTAVVIRIEGPAVNGEPTLSINGSRVSRDRFAERLQSESAKSPSQCPAYLQGDPDLPYQTIVDVLDTIRAQGSDAALTLSR